MSAVGCVRNTGYRMICENLTSERPVSRVLLFGDAHVQITEDELGIIEVLGW